MDPNGWKMFNCMNSIYQQEADWETLDLRTFKYVNGCQRRNFQSCLKHGVEVGIECKSSNSDP